MKVLVCGGRDYADAESVSRALDSLVGVTEVICGDATGADAHALAWARNRGVTAHVFHARWETFGRSAGPRRNTDMLKRGKPDGVIAFPGGRGTADMVRQARAAGVPVLKPVA